MAKNTITINEAQLQALVTECVNEVLNEGLWDQAKAGFQGAMKGFQGQKMLDRGTDNFKQNWDREDLANNANPWSARPENTADMQAKEAYQMYKYHKSESDKYLALYNKLTNQYKLNKDGVGQRSTSQKSGFYGTGGIIANRRQRGGKFGGSVVGRDRTNDTRGRGLWG